MLPRAHVVSRSPCCNDTEPTLDTSPVISTLASAASGPADAARCADGGSARQQRASSDRRFADDALKWLVAQRHGDGPRVRSAYARRSSIPERTCPPRRRRRGASTDLGAPPQASPLFRLVSDHLHRLQTVYDKRFAREYGPWRRVGGQVADKFLACGILEHGFARFAARTVTAAARTLTGERELTVGIVACLRTHGSRANWHPHLHLLITDGGFRPDGTFVSWPVHDTARLREAFRRGVLRLFVRLDLFDHDQASGMLTWPHSGFHVHTAVWVPEDDRAFATRLARYRARNPVALERLT